MSPEPRVPPVLVAALLAAVPFGALVVAVAVLGVDVPYWDDWELVPLLVELDRGTLGLDDLWAPHNEHRVIFARALQLSLAAATEWNVRAVLFLDVALAVLIFLLAWRLLERTRRSVRPFSPPSWWIGPLVALLVFGLVQHENFFWSWQMVVFLATAAVLAGFGLLADAAERWPALGLAAGLGVVATWSFGVGLLYWPLALVLVARPAPRRAARIATWLVISGAVIAVTLRGVARTPPDPGRAGLDLVLHFGAYVALWIGSPVFQHLHHQAALWGGFLAIGLFAALAIGLPILDPRRARTARWLWITVGAFTVASAVAAGTARLHLGIGQALSSRYATVANLFWIALLGLLLTLPPARVRPRAAQLAGATAAMLLVWQTIGGLAIARDASRQRAEVRRAIVAGEPADLGVLYPFPEVARQRLEQLDELGWGPRRDRGSAVR